MYTPDNVMAWMAGEFRRVAQRVGARIIHPIEVHTPNQNKAEKMAREIKCMYRREMRRLNSPLIFWDKCFQLQCLTINSLQGLTPEEMLKVDMADISHLVECQWYQWVWYVVC